jgi:hypothetical protein
MGKTIRVTGNIDEGYVEFNNVTIRQEEVLKSYEETVSFITKVAILSKKFPNDQDLGKEVRKLVSKNKKK